MAGTGACNAAVGTDEGWALPWDKQDFKGMGWEPGWRRDVADVEGQRHQRQGRVRRVGVEHMGGGAIGKAGPFPTALLPPPMAGPQTSSRVCCDRELSQGWDTDRQLWTQQCGRVSESERRHTQRPHTRVTPCT